MSKVVHLSDDAHTRAKNFCKQHGLKMSDWVADLIAVAISEVRVDPRSKPTQRAMPPPPPPPVAQHIESRPAPAAHHHPEPRAIPQAPPHNPNQPPKKRLERIEERPARPVAAAAPATDDGVPPWSQPPFWNQKAR